MKTVVNGLKESKGSNFREPVFYKHCAEQKDRDEAVEDALLNGAEIVIVTRVDIQDKDNGTGR